MYWAALNGHREIVELLLSHGADPNSALASAARGGHIDIVQMLLSHGADPKKDDALYKAAFYGHREIVELLLSHGADPNSGDALYEAALNGHREIVELLLSHGADPNSGDPLAAAVRSKDIDILRLLLDKGADIESSHALERAVNENLDDIVSFFLLRGADPNKIHSEIVDDYRSVKNKLAREKEQIQHHQKEYAEGIRDAVEKPRNITVTVVGHKGVGKSCLVKQLKQESIPKGGPGSTDTADFYVNYLAFNPKTGFRQKLDVDGEINTARRRLRMIVDQHRKQDTTDDGEPEPVQHFSNIPHRHLLMNKSEPQLAPQDIDTTEPFTKGKMAVTGNPDKEPENQYNGKSKPSPPVSTAPHLSLTTKEQKTGFGRKMKQFLSRVMFRKRPKSKFSTKVSTEQKELVQEIMRTETSDGDNEVKGFVTIYDFGGEKVFYNTIHCFLSSNMVFVIVIDVDMCLDPEKSATGYEITGLWLKNVATYAVDDARTDVRTPPIILVGSHLDKLSADEAEQEEKFGTVLDKLNADPHLREIMDNQVLGVFAIANLNDSTKNKELYEYIWQTVLRIAPLQSQWMKPVPARWVALQHELVRLKHAGVTVMMFEDLMDTNSRLPVPLHEEEIKPFLLNLKLNGSFHCFGLEGKSPFLVLKAQWTIDAFKAVITDPKFTASLSHMLSRKWKQYEKSGVLRLELLLELWADEIFFEKREILFIVMETLNLIAKPVLEDPDADVDYYIVPSMLRNADLEVIQPILDAPDTITTVTLCLKFNKPFIPQAVWDKMIASCIHRFGSLHLPAHEELTFIWRGFACLAVDSVWNVIIHCKDNAMKVTMFKNAKEDTPQERVGAGVSVLCILEFLLKRILESNHQKHLDYQFYFHKDYRITSSDKMVKKDDLQKNTSAKCHGLKGEQWIDRDEIYTWFKHPNSEKLEVTSNIGELMARLPKRKLTYREVNRVSRFIGNGCRTFFVELDLPIETLEQEMEEHRHLAFRSRITKLFVQRMKLKAGMDFATVADAMSRNGMDPTKLTSVIDENRESVFVDDRLPVPWLQKPLSVNDVPVIERYLDVKAYFSLFLELGFSPKTVDDFDDQYRHKATSEKIKALLKAFITESKPRPTRNAILLAMRECNMDTESLITALKNT
ncbi:uncharacterized protein [Argopecten irradians]|uniref:uncharacterized protein isoform X4 n=1 Tax=Argopecten irradians TaxID=31199 RepID=UPI0037176457